MSRKLTLIPKITITTKLEDGEDVEKVAQSVRMIIEQSIKSLKVFEFSYEFREMEAIIEEEGKDSG